MGLYFLFRYVWLDPHADVHQDEVFSGLYQIGRRMGNKNSFTAVSQHESIDSNLLLTFSKNQDHTTKLRKNNLFTRKTYILKNKQNNVTYK